MGGMGPGSISRPDSKSQASASRTFWTACKEQWEQWLATHDPEDAISCKIQSAGIRGAGAEVLIISADVANHAQMQAAIAQSLKRFGKIHGVIHAAGVAGAGMIQLKTPEIAVAPQTYGNVGTGRI